MVNQQGLLESCYSDPDTLIRVRRNAKPVLVIHCNYMEMSTQASSETAKTWKSFNDQGTQKVLLISDELWLICNSIIFASWK